MNANKGKNAPSGSGGSIGKRAAGKSAAALSARAALFFVICMGTVSLFSDMTYEGARSITGPFLQILGASAAAVGIVAGLGELIGYAFRLATGFIADKTRRYWFLTILGYIMNLAVVPLLASLFLVLERFGKAIRKPSAKRDIVFPMAKRLVLVSLIAAALGVAPCMAAEQVISVLYFANTTQNADYGWLSKGLTDMLITDLAGTGQLTVIEREDIEKILKQQEQALSDMFDEQSAVRIGRLLSAKQIVIGSFIVLQSNLRIDAKLVDVESARVLKAVQSSGDMGALFDLEKKLAVNLLKEMGITVSGQMAPNETNSMDAAKAYYTGMNFLDTGAYAQAAAQFKQAANIDPFYLKPQKSLEEAYQFLKDFRNQRYQREINELYQKAAEIKKRLAAPVWLTYSDFLSQSYAKGLSVQEIQKLTDANPSYYICDTRAQCVWNLQMTLQEIGDKAAEYFEDTGTESRMHTENLNIVQQARTQFKTDPFLPEILYQELFSLQYFKRWDDVMKACEYLMTTFPSYRMMWAVEDFYERALEKKGGKSE
jgi:TolB-like protein